MSACARRSLTSLLLAALLPGLPACTTTASTRLADDAAPVKAVWVVTSLGSFDSAPMVAPGARLAQGVTGQAWRERLPEVLRRNGLAVSGYRQLPRALSQLDELERLWSVERTKQPDTSHVLVITAQRLKMRGGVGTIEYEAVLWDAATHRLVWKGAPVGPAQGRSPGLDAELLAGDVLRGLDRDRVNPLPKGYPVGLDGAEIPRQWQPLLN